MALVAIGALSKIYELSAGGEYIALILGGRPVNPQTDNPAERRLLNVVEEMSLASGVPVPPVYVLQKVEGINAFAAGHQASDAVVAVSAGCLQYLTRAELQGVLGHEFSHILNGDMRLNLRLVGLLYGLQILPAAGYYIGPFFRAAWQPDSILAIFFVIPATMLVIVFGIFLVFFAYATYLFTSVAVLLVTSPVVLANLIKSASTGNASTSPTRLRSSSTAARTVLWGR